MKVIYAFAISMALVSRCWALEEIASIQLIEKILDARAAVNLSAELELYPEALKAKSDGLLRWMLYKAQHNNGRLLEYRKYKTVVKERADTKYIDYMYEVKYENRLMNETYTFDFAVKPNELVSILFVDPNGEESTTHSPAEEGPECWKKYEYKGKTNGPGGSGGPIMSKERHDAFAYKLCKTKCYGKLPDYKNIVGIKTCALDGVDIEDSKYKNIYLKHKKNICHVKVVGKHTFNLYLVKDETECKASMDDFIWCKKGEKCTYTLGQW